MVEKTTVTVVPSSPYATGGGGVRFEDRVGALCLARLLTGTVMSELGRAYIGDIDARKRVFNEAYEVRQARSELS